MLISDKEKTMTEYEYSFEVKSLDKYIAYLESNGFENLSESEQIRTVYQSDNGTIARITTDSIGGKIRRTLDFKQGGEGGLLNERQESKALVFEDTDAVKSILDFLGYKEKIVLNRIRYVYTCGDVKCELDKYTSPFTSNVVAVEGEKALADKVYNEIKDI